MPLISPYKGPLDNPELQKWFDLLQIQLNEAFPGLDDYDEDWVEPDSYEANWSAQSAGENFRYRKYPTGFLLAEGIVTRSGAATAGEDILEMPEGRRPAIQQGYGTFNGAPNAAGNISVDPDGKVRYFTGPTTYIYMCFGYHVA